MFSDFANPDLCVLGLQTADLGRPAFHLPVLSRPAPPSSLPRAPASRRPLFGSSPGVRPFCPALSVGHFMLLSSHSVPPLHEHLHFRPGATPPPPSATFSSEACGALGFQARLAGSLHLTRMWPIHPHHSSSSCSWSPPGPPAPLTGQPDLSSSPADLLPPHPAHRTSWLAPSPPACVWELSTVHQSFPLSAQKCGNRKKPTKQTSHLTLRPRLLSSKNRDNSTHFSVVPEPSTLHPSTCLVPAATPSSG